MTNKTLKDRLSMAFVTVALAMPKIGAVIACLPSAAMIGLGLWHLLFDDQRLNLGYAFCFFLIPGLILFLTIRMLRKDLPYLSAFFRTLGLWALFLLLLFFALVVLSSERHHVFRLDSPGPAAEEFRPYEPFSELELGDPLSLELHKCTRKYLVGETHVSALLCRYGPEEYAAEKAALEGRFHFRENPMKCNDPVTWEALQFEPMIQIGDDVFRFLEPWDYRFGPFYMFSALVVTNDETQEICYLVYGDDETDYITDLTSFIKFDCCWDMIR